MSGPLDLITIGRVSVDLYGQQIGSALEDVASFAKAVGGCPANVAIGAARLGLKAALISRVGDEPMGRFVLGQLAREGVEAHGVRVDPARLTALVLLSVRDTGSFPLIFYRENCADAALCEEDIEAQFVARARAVLLTGTHFSLPAAARAQRKAMDIARSAGAKIILDIDYRPNLWGIGGHDAGHSRYARSPRVTEELSSVLPHCDLVVGTEEELHVAAGVEDTLDAVRRLRAHSAATILCKLGARGCVVFEGPIPTALEQGLVAPGMPVEVYNVLGAGDAFLAGFLSGYLRGESLASSARRANACGAIAVSRLLCSSEFATRSELEHYLAHGSSHRALREDPWLSHLHRVGTRRRAPEELCLLAIHPAAAAGERSAHFTSLCVEAAARAAAGRAGFGVLFEGATPALPALRAAASGGLWAGRVVPDEVSPLAPTESAAAALIEWPTAIAAACRASYDPHAPQKLRQLQERELLQIAAACQTQQRELLLEVARAGEADSTAALAHLYELDIRPDWWSLGPQPDGAAWTRCQQLIGGHDPFCRGILVRIDAPAAAALRVAAANPAVRGIVAGGTIAASTAQAWLSGQLSDTALVAAVAECFRTLAADWSAARAGPDRNERSTT